MIEVPDEADRASPQVPYNVFDEQLQDLVLAGEVSADSSYEYLSLRSPAATIAGKVRQILALVNRCNAAVKLRGDQPAIFKATYMVMEAYTDLPCIRNHLLTGKILRQDTCSYHYIVIIALGLT